MTAANPAVARTPSRPLRRVSPLRRWHRWCGLAVLLFLLVAAITGSLLVYKKALIRLLITPDAALPASLNSSDMATELDRIVAIIGLENVGLIKVPNSQEPYWTVIPPLAEKDVKTEKIPIRLLAIGTLEPYKNNLWLLDSLAFIRKLHTDLLVGEIGEALLLASTAGGLFLSITGVVIWWPTRKSFRWRWVLPRPMARQMLIHSHRHGGVVAAAVLIIVLVTGGIMLWQKLVRPILPPVAAQPLPQSFKGGETLNPSWYLLTAAAAVPDGWPTYIRLPGITNSEANIRFRLPGEWHANGRTAVNFDARQGTVTLTTRSDQVSPARNVLNQLYPLHSGYGMGVVYVALIFLSGVAMLWLGISGGLSYLARRSR
ncbi:MAG: PepSY domain-containing protein [Porticoccaceae bacterium]|nr:PepSY domain-containing protein [Porticoccaceae bacterium]